MIGSISSSELDRLRQDGQRFRSGPFQLVVSVDDTRRGVGIGYSIGRRDGSAVRRNRLRRRLRAAFASVHNDSPLPYGVYLVICRPPSMDLSYSAIYQHIVRLSGSLRDLL